MKRLVVVGGGLGGHRALLAARKHGFTGELVLISGEVHKPYDRPPLSKGLLSADDDGSAHFYSCDELADVTWKLGSAASSLDSARKTVTLESGEQVTYDGLVIATGRRARAWPGQIPQSGVFTIRDLNDSLAMRRSISAESRVVIIGAGFIGLEAAATLVGRGVQSVTVVEAAPFPMPVVGPAAAASARRFHGAHGVDVRCGVTIEKIEGVDRPEAVVLAGGERLLADVVLVSIGSIPNTDWVADSGLELWRGNILTDEHCFAVGADSIVAVGDVAAWPHPFVGETINIEHWAIARDMAEIAVCNLLGVNSPYGVMDTVPTFWSDQYNVKIKSAGFLGIATSFKTIEEDTEKPSLIVEAYRGDALVGAIVFNKNKAIIGYQRRIAELIAESTAISAN